MKKKLSFLIILVVALAALLVAFAACEEPAFEGANDDFYFTGKGGNITITAFKHETADAVTIPSEIKYNGAIYKVTGIGENCFKENAALLRATIPASVESVGASAFEGCKNLLYIDFTGESENFVLGERAFAGLTKLKRINLPASTASIPKECFKDSFEMGSDILTTVVLGESVTEIGESAFENANIQAINLPASLKTIGERAFWYANDVKDVFSVPASVSSIGGGAFAGCGYNKVAISEENQHYVFESSYYLMTADKKTLVCYTSTGTPSFSNSATKEITKIERYGGGKSSSTSVILPAKINEIGEFAFYEYSAATFDIKATDCVFVANSFAQNAKFLLPANSFTYKLAEQYKNMSVGDYANNWTLETN